MHQSQMSLPKIMFEPEISVDALPDASAREHAMQVLSLVQSEHQVLRIKEAVSVKVNAALQSVGPAMLELCSSELRHAWMLQNYFAVVEHVVKDGMSESLRGAVIAPLPVAAVDFKPEISVAELPDDAARLHATQVLSKLQKHHVLRIKEELETCLKAALQSIEPSMLELCESDLRHAWMLKHYCPSLNAWCLVASMRPELMFRAQLIPLDQRTWHPMLLLLQCSVLRARGLAFNQLQQLIPLDQRT